MGLSDFFKITSSVVKISCPVYFQVSQHTRFRIDVDTETGAGPVKVKSFDEAKKLAPGTLFETPDGKIIRRD